MAQAGIRTAVGKTSPNARAKTLYDRLALGPAQPELYLECAKALQASDQHARAIEVLRAGAAQHEDSSILRLLGLAYAQNGRKTDARDTWQRLLTLNPADYDAHNNLGVLLQESGRLGEAIEHLRKATEIDPRNASGLNNLGVALSEARRLEESAACYNRALALAPDFTIVWNNLGNALRGLGRSRDAAVALQTAIRLRPDYAEAYNNLAITYAQLEDSQAAMKAFDQSLFLRPDYPEAHMNRGLQHLLLGDFKRGWADYEWRWHEKLLKPRYAHLKRWDGSNVVGKRVLLYYEQGLGDTFNFIRYATELKARGAHVIFECQPVLRQILACTPGIDQFVIRGDKLPPADVGAPLLSLPGVLESDLDTLPAKIPYIFTAPDLIAKWRERLAHVAGFRIAIVWQGNPNHRGDWKRSIPLAKFQTLAKIPGISFISLQKGHGEEQLQSLKDRFPVLTFPELGKDEDGFLRTAAILKNIDLVICADTSIAHLAGAMGIPAWVLLPVAPDWRWLLSREDTPWYPALRLFRQKKLHDWDAVFADVAVALHQLLAIGSARTTDATTRHKAKALHQQAISLLQQQRPAEAVPVLEQATVVDPAFAPAHHDLGILHAQEKRLPQAISHLRRALELEPSSPSAHANIGTAFLQQHQHDEAVSHFQKCIRLGGGTANVYNDLGSAWLDLDQPEKAEAALWSALRIEPFHPRAHYNLARALLVQGKFADGWLEFGWRAHLQHKERPRREKPRWTGDYLRQRVVLLIAEHGLADTLQFARYCLLVRRYGGRVILKCQSVLVDLIRHSQLAEQVLPLDAPSPPHDFSLPLLDLPGVFHTSLESIPAQMPYIRTPVRLASEWSKRLAHLPHPRIAISWEDASRRPQSRCAFTNELLRQLAQVEGLSFVSLGPPPPHIQLPTGMDRRLFVAPPAEDASKTLLQQAAMLANVDLLIAPDSLPAHLAGAMNIPSYVALPHGASWRWLRHRSDSPWYPSLTLFRQHSPSQWDQVIDEMSQALDAFVQTHTGPDMQSTGKISPRFRQLCRDGLAALSAGDLALAIVDFEQALCIEPSSPAALHHLGTAYFRLQQHSRAAECFEQVLLLQPGSASATSNLAAALDADGHHDKAIKLVSDALSINPRAFELHFRLGILLLARSHLAAAAGAFDNALGIRPDSAQALLQRAKIACAQSDFDRAARHAEAALRSANLAEAHDVLARCRLASGAYPQAQLAIDRALEIEPEFPERLALRATILEHRGRIDDALTTLKQAVYRSPKNSDYRRRLVRLNAARGNLHDMLAESQWHIPAPQRGIDLLNPRNHPPSRNSARRDIFLVAPPAHDQTLFLLRFLPLLRSRAQSLRLFCSPEIAPILRQAPALDGVIAEPPPKSHPLVHLAAIPFALKPDRLLLFPKTPYLSANEALLRDWSSLLASKALPPQRLIAVAETIATDPASTHATKTLHAVLDILAQDPSLRLCGLSTHPAMQNQDAVITARLTRNDNQQFLHHFAALATHADIVLTTDTLFCHLAGAMARPSCAILPAPGHAGWHHTGETSPWYPTVRPYALDPDQPDAAFPARVATALANILRDLPDHAQNSQASMP